MNFVNVKNFEGLSKMGRMCVYVLLHMVRQKKMLANYERQVRKLQINN